MNSSLLAIEFLVVLLGLGVLLADLWIPATARRGLAYAAVTGLLLILTLHGGALAPEDHTAFAGMFLVDALSNYFKTLLIVAAIVVLLISSGYSDRLEGYGEYVALTLFALTGMLLAASANDFILMFVAWVQVQWAGTAGTAATAAAGDGEAAGGIAGRARCTTNAALGRMRFTSE